jgi:hypothetical protein
MQATLVDVQSLEELGHSLFILGISPIERQRKVLHCATLLLKAQLLYLKEWRQMLELQWLCLTVIVITHFE